MNSFLADSRTNYINYRILNSEEQAAFLENMTLRLVGFSNAFGTYHDKEKFNRLLTDKADKFILEDKEIITNPNHIKNILKKPNQSQFVLLRNPNPDKPWEYSDKIRNVMFGFSSGSLTAAKDRYVIVQYDKVDEIHIDDDLFERTGIFDIHEQCICSYVKAIIPPSHDLIGFCFRQAETGRIYKSYR